MSTEIDDIKNKLDIVDVIGETVSLTQSDGNTWKGAINTGSKSGSSLHVDRGQQLWNNWASGGEGGDVLDWIAFNENININSDFPAVLKIAADKAGIKLKNEIQLSEDVQDLYMFFTSVANHYHNQLTDEYRDLITKKWGISNETINKLKIGFAPVNENVEKVYGIFGKDLIEKSGLFIKFSDTKMVPLFNGRIIFPYWKNGKPIYFIGRHTKDTPDRDYEKAKYKKQMVHSQKKPYVSQHIDNNYFYGEDSIRKSDFCLITEGVTDCIMAIQEGIPCISPVTIRFKKDHNEKIAEMVYNINQVVICNDNEDTESGKEGALDTVEFLKTKGINVRIVELPRESGVDKVDLADYLRDHTANEFKDLINESLSLEKVKLSDVPISIDQTENVKRSLSFISNNFNGQSILTKRTFIEQHIKNHFSFSTKIIDEIVIELKRLEKENKKEKKEIKQSTDVIEIPNHIKKAADDILRKTNVMDYIIDVHNTMHVGDDKLAKSLMVSIAIQSVRNSDGIHPKVSGSSGTGKSHCCEAMVHLLPTEYKYEGSLSTKSIYYMNLNPGTVVFSDDVDMNDDFETVIKRATTKFQDGDTHTTIINQETNTFHIPARIVWWLTSVDDDQSVQLLNRTFGGTVDDSEEQDKAVSDFQKRQAKHGLLSFPENDDIEVCRQIYRVLKEKLFVVDIPFADRIDWRDTSNRRNLPIFFDIIAAMTVLRFRQRQLDDENHLIAEIEDYEDAKNLYAERARTQGLKLTKIEQRLVIALNDSGKCDIKYIQDSIGLSRQRVHTLLHGITGKPETGLLFKVPKLNWIQEQVGNDNGSTRKNYYVLTGFDIVNMFDSVVQLLDKPTDSDAIAVQQPCNSTAIYNKYINNTNSIRDCCSTATVAIDNENKESENISNSTKSENIVSRSEIVAERCNGCSASTDNENNSGSAMAETKAPIQCVDARLPHGGQKVLAKHLKGFVNANYKSGVVGNFAEFVGEFMKAHEIYKPYMGTVIAFAEKMKERGWK